MEKMKINNMKRLISLLLAVLLVFTVGSISVLAGNGDGTGGGDHNAALHLESVRYSTDSGYADLDGASVSGTLSGYIRFDRGMTTYSADNMNYIVLLDEDNEEVDSIILNQATSDITDDGTTYDKKYLYTFSISGLGSGSYRLGFLSGIKANNGQTLTGAPLYKTFTVL